MLSLLSPVTYASENSEAFRMFWEDTEIEDLVTYKLVKVYQKCKSALAVYKCKIVKAKSVSVKANV